MAAVPDAALPFRIARWFAQIDDWVDQPDDKPEAIRLYIQQTTFRA